MAGNICFHSPTIDLFNSPIWHIQLSSPFFSTEIWNKEAFNIHDRGLCWHCWRISRIGWKSVRSMSLFKRNFKDWFSKKLIDRILHFIDRFLTFLQIVLVRMCADGAKAPAQRFAYSNAISGILRVGREEGLGAFFKGLGPNVVRSVLMSKLTRRCTWPLSVHEAVVCYKTAVILILS